MYFEHFGLKEPPFKITPNTDVFFTGGNRGAVLDAITYAILNGEGIVKVVGEVGSGKTMICRMLQTMLPDRVESIYLANPSVAPEDVLHAIAFELQIKLPKYADRLKVMQALQTHLLKRHAAGKQVVIFIEEAQGMPLATLEEIRLLSNLETNYDKLLQIVLFGQPELDENLNEINIRQLRERITHSFHLPPLQSNEIGEYILFRLRAAGYYGPHLFTKSAIRKLSSAAQGLVRRVNILADKALLAAFSENAYQVTSKHVQAAISDSEFGLERAKVKQKGIKAILILIVLALGLVLGYFASQLLANDKTDKSNKIIQKSNTAIEALKPVELVPGSSSERAVQPTKELIDATAEALVNNDIISRRIAATNSWLTNQPPSTVSIQLMGAPEGPELVDDLEKLSQKIELDEIYVYRTQVSGQPYLSVLYGSFDNRVTALSALKGLPEEIRRNKPQLRTISGVLQETKQLQ
ncbi:MAG TPA: AAA family ATPase [Methylophilaceae bacterium]|nr:AAA family ATPase [Methylophilaceae bacterium]